MQINRQKIASLGSLDVDLKFLEIGKGRPVISIVTGVHGDETAGLFAIKKLLEKISTVDGLLRIIPSANPFAQATLFRKSLVDGLDLNRVFSKKEKKSLTGMTGELLYSVIKDSDVVIDMHSSKLRTPLMGVLFQHEDMDEKNKKMLNIFSPEQVWVINPEKEKKYSGTMSNKLNKNNIINFGVELEEDFTDEDINNCVKGIINILKEMKMIGGKPCIKKNIPYFRKKFFRTKKSGMFTPLKESFDKIEKDDLLGSLTILPDFKEEKIFAEESGVILQIKKKTMVLPGMSLYSVGTRL